MSKKRMIMEKAIELFSQNSIETTSIQDITTACGISKGAFYLSFKSKDDLLVEIVDYFMKKIILQHNIVLNDPISGEKKLRKFFYSNFKLLEENYSFITMCMREQLHPINDQIVQKLNDFSAINDETILILINETYGNLLGEGKFDLLTSIKGLMWSFTEFIATHPAQYDLEKLTDTLLEKTNILAKHSSIHFLNETIWRSQSTEFNRNEISKEKVLEELERSNETFEHSPIILESLQLLKSELETPSPRLAILLGLAANLQRRDEFSWLTFLIKQYTATLGKES
ncbi:TetR/AcrR family transcriptional regulator [Ureibacillus sp. NPDC094379]